MSKWEYCAVGPIKNQPRDELKGNHPNLYLFTKDGLSTTKLEESLSGKGKRDDIAKIIAKLGLEGWEMVGLGTVTLNLMSHIQPGHLIYFKRSIE